MELKEGMYVRTYKGIIDKLDDKNIKMYQVSMFGLGDKPIKASNNIIDLMEVGDYVNGCKVVNINYDIDYDEDIVQTITIFDHSIEERDNLYNDNIKSIVTKEQFESMKYSLEG